jgi:ABC-type lipoprotein export system ATPase subunit
MMSSTTIIRFDEVSKVYATRHGAVHALENVSLTVAAGQYVAVCGPSGCGKSTLLSLIGGLALPTSGRITVGDLAMSRATSGLCFNCFTCSRS